MKNKIIVFGLIAVLTISMGSNVFATTKSKTADTATTSATTEASVGDAKDDDQNLANVSVAISEAVATQTALDSIPGSTLVTAHLEDEDGVIVYGVEVNDGTQTYDIKVDANTGTILKSESGLEGDDNDQLGDDQEDDQQLESKNHQENDGDQIEHENDQEDQDGHED
jgi:uncharacterized membrane protein YkoI